MKKESYNQNHINHGNVSIRSPLLMPSPVESACAESLRYLNQVQVSRGVTPRQDNIDNNNHNDSKIDHTASRIRKNSLRPNLEENIESIITNFSRVSKNQSDNQETQEPREPSPPHLRITRRVSSRSKIRKHSESPPLVKKSKISRNTKNSQKKKLIQIESNVTSGSSCHQCKSRRNLSDLIYCSNILDKKTKSCRKKYCEHCLQKFYNDSINNIGYKSKWKCPSCRHCCSCAACRRREREREDGFGFTPPQPVYSYKKTRNTRSKDRPNSPTILELPPPQSSNNEVKIKYTPILSSYNSPALSPSFPHLDNDNRFSNLQSVGNSQLLGSSFLFSKKKHDDNIDNNLNKNSPIQGIGNTTSPALTALSFVASGLPPPLSLLNDSNINIKNDRSIVDQDNQSKIQLSV